MADKLIVLTFDGESTAETVMDHINDMEQRGLIELEDAVVVTRAPHVDRLQMVAGVDSAHGLAIHRFTPYTEPEIKQTDSRRKRTSAKGAGIGLLAGWLLGGPIGGAAVGAVIGAQGSWH